MTRFRGSLLAGTALLLAQVCSTGPAAGATLHSSARATAPRTISLSVSDVNANLGGGFTRLGNIGISALGPGISNLQVVKQSGYVTGYGSMFQRQRPLPLMVMTGVNLFRSEAMAAASIRRLLSVYSTASNRKAGIRVSTMTGVGDTAALFSFSTRSSSGKTVRELGVLFSRGVYAADVVIIGTGRIDQSRLLTLTKVLDNRITHA